jgi:hypothetical protein
VRRDLRHEIEARLGLVPALFDELACEPGLLAATWRQALALWDDPRAPGVAERLRAAADPRLPYRPSPAVRALVEPFVRALPLMLLLVASVSDAAPAGYWTRRPLLLCVLEAHGLLVEPQAAIEPFLDSEAGRQQAEELAALARFEATRLASMPPHELHAHRLFDEYARTLPRTLILVAAASAL